ncbi:ATP-grasp domain-containing protein [Deinococcus sp.]|uniref:ATP-grasp domain-containing protein n=1 Tax=Deinococcus sp. TaxID=47478 RepID=UPI0025CE7B71|nr:ATP-grasp domain-containing protein [Deinococcus sp.]
MPAAPLPTIWFTKNINPTLHRVREVAQSGRYHVLASHVSPDASYLGEAHEAFLEPHPLEPGRYPDYVLDMVRARGVRAVVGGRYVSALAERRADFGAAGCHLIVAGQSADSFDLCDDKARFYKVFSGRIPMPETVPVQSWDELEAAALELETRHGSACFKPARGIYGHGFRILTPRHQTRSSELERFFGGDHLRISYEAAALLLGHQDLPPLLAMQTLPGKEYSVDALARRGTLLTCVVRRKIGGLGNVQMSQGAPELREWVALLARELKMDGLFNAQFREDETGAPRLLEVNARASGGLAISAALSGLKLGLLEVDAHFGAPLGDLSFTPGRRVTDAREVITLGEYGPVQESALDPSL